MKKGVRWVLIAAMTFQPFSVFGKTHLPTAKRTLTDKSRQQVKTRAPRLHRPERDNEITDLSLALVTRLYRTTASDLEFYKRVFFPYLNPVDRQPVADSLRHLTEWPSVEHNGNALIFKTSNKTYRVEVIDTEKMAFKVNSVQFTYNPNLPLMTQIHHLERKLNPWKESVLFNIFVPQAHANAAAGLTVGAILTLIITTGMGTTVSTVISNAISEGIKTFKDVLCERKIDEKKHQLTEHPECKDWYDRRTSSMSLSKAPILDAIKKLNASDRTNVLAKFMAKEWECPDKNDGKERTYYATVTSTDSDKARSNEINTHSSNILVRMQPDGTPIFVLILPNNLTTDVDKLPPQDTLEAEALAKYAFDSELRMKSVTVRNPDYDTDKAGLTAPPKWITLAKGSNLSPEQDALLMNLQDLITYTNYKITLCTISTFKRNQQHGIETGSPEKPVHDDTTPAAPSAERTEARPKAVAK